MRSRPCHQTKQSAFAKSDFPSSAPKMFAYLVANGFFVLRRFSHSARTRPLPDALHRGCPSSIQSSSLERLAGEFSTTDNAPVPGLRYRVCPDGMLWVRPVSGSSYVEPPPRLRNGLDVGALSGDAAATRSLFVSRLKGLGISAAALGGTAAPPDVRGGGEGLKVDALLL